MGPEQWREMCQKHGENVWSLIIQLLQFAAAENPEEFKRRRDGIAEALFSPELSGRKTQDGFQRAADDSELYVPSSWAPQSAGSAATDTSEPQAGNRPAPHPRPGPTRELPSKSGQRQQQTGQAPERTIPPQSRRAAGTEYSPSKAFVARLDDSASAEAPLADTRTSIAEAHQPDAPSDIGEPPFRPSHEPGSASLPKKPKGASSREHGKEAQARFRNVPPQQGTWGMGNEVLRGNELGEPSGQSDDRGAEDTDGCDELPEDVPEDLSSEELVLEQVKAAKAFLSGGSSPTAADLVARLRELQDIPMTIEALRVSQIGKVVKNLGKGSKDSKVQGLCRDLIRHWKRLVEETCTVEVELGPPPAGQGTGNGGACAPEEDGEGGAEGKGEGGQGGEAVGVGAEGEEGSLPAPPMDEDVLHMADMVEDILDENALAGALSDFDSLESELSGSVGSAGVLAPSKTPESHRGVLASSESSPCETSRPLASPRRSSGVPQAGAALSVLSNSVRKTEWEGHQGREPKPSSVALRQDKSGVAKTEATREDRSSVMHETQRQQQGRRQEDPSGENQGPRRDIMRNAFVRSKGDVKPMDAPKLTPPRPSTAKKLDKEEQERLEMSKRRLQESYQIIGEAKKAKTIQVVDPEPKRGRPKSLAGRHHQQHHPVLGAARSGHRSGRPF